MPGQRPGSQTLHLCVFQSPKATKHHTRARPSACGALSVTPMQIRALKPHLDRRGLHESKFGRGCTVPESEKRRTKSLLDTVIRFQNVTRAEIAQGSRRCAGHDSIWRHKAQMRFPIMATKPKRGPNTLELRLCMFGAARAFWSYACACLAPSKRSRATPVHVWCSTGHKKIQEIMK